MHIAIIGGGASGVCAARHVVHTCGMTCVLYEQTGELGGTWVYSEYVGKDENGLPVHTSMYKGLCTNLPKETMEYPDFPWKENNSFVPAKEVLNYIQDYVDHFKIKEHVKFHHHVTKVHPVGTKWEVTTKDVKNNQEAVEHFDAVMVCIGRFSVPYFAPIKGLHQFKGEIMHSHDYRSPERFCGKSLFVIGGGPSGIEICTEVHQYVDKIYFTYHKTELNKKKLNSKIQIMPEVIEITSNGAIFEDGSSIEVDCIIFCTGYDISYPFFTAECGVTVEQGRFVQPLYKHMIHIFKPTLCFIGLAFFTLLFDTFDIQAQFFLKTLIGKVQLPSPSEMLADTAKDIEQKKEEGLSVKFYHKLGVERIMSYLGTLCTVGQIRPVRPVVFNILVDVYKQFKDDKVKNYRDIEYRIVSDLQFTRNGVLIE